MQSFKFIDMFGQIINRHGTIQVHKMWDALSQTAKGAPVSHAVARLTKTRGDRKPTKKELKALEAAQAEAEAQAKAEAEAEIEEEMDRMEYYG